jgi:predicted nucleotidyltransferase
MVDSNTISILKSVLEKHLQSNCKSFIYGSRTHANHRKFSDLDIGILGPIKLSASTLVSIQSELSDSNIPYLVDVVDFSAVSNSFKNKALTNIINL